MDTDVDVDIGDKFAYIYGPSAIGRSVNQQVLEAFKVTTGICNRVLP